MGNYNLRPEIKIKARSKTSQGYSGIAEAIKKQLKKRDDRAVVLSIECYPGVNLMEIEEQLLPLLEADRVFYADDFAMDSETVENRIQDVLTDDRVFGVLSHYQIADFYPQSNIEAARKQIEESQGLVVVYGFGTDIFVKPDMIVYADMTRWEIQLRYRKGLCNWKADNPNEDNLRKNKRGYFFEWRMADRQKNKLYEDIDFMLDTTVEGKPVMVDGEGFRAAIYEAAHQPFRLVPYFDPSVWGGHWMQKKFNLDPERENFGWSFDGVPEENSLILNFDGVQFETPSINVVFRQPDALLGPKVHARFGTEFPIRFDYLDTMGGGNLSLQVHPLVEYAQDRFGIHYTQDESYYILDASDHSSVYLGVKEGVKKEELIAELTKAQDGNAPFPDEKFINNFPVKKHDHILIPAGTIHCSGPDTVVLEISSTPYIFTFKLWDWGRIGLDGLPRPVHIEHGSHNIQMNRDTKFCNEQLVDRIDDYHKNLSDQDGVKTEHTGLHELEFLETRRHWFKNEVHINTTGSVSMMNLIEGEQADIISLDGSFEPFRVHYGETFIIPESVKECIIRNAGKKEKEIAVIQAYVRT